MPELPEVIDSTEEIAAFFESVAQARNPLLISPAGHEVFTSSVIGLEHNAVHIDQLMPDEGNALLKAGVPVEIRVTYEGVPHLFQTTPIAYSSDKKGYPYHEISVPEQVKYLRKRSSYRIPFKLSESPRIRVWLAQEKSSEAWIENISDSGAALRFKGAQADIDLQSIIECEIQLAELEKLKCQAVVRHNRYLPKFDETRLGIEFWKLPKSHAKNLHGAIMKLQRHNIRTDLTL